MSCGSNDENRHVLKPVTEPLPAISPKVIVRQNGKRFSCERLRFGLASAPEMFQAILKDFMNVHVSIDDILIYEDNMENIRKTSDRVIEFLKKFQRGSHQCWLGCGRWLLREPVLRSYVGPIRHE